MATTRKPSLEVKLDAGWDDVSARAAASEALERDMYRQNDAIIEGKRVQQPAPLGGCEAATRAIGRHAVAAANQFDVLAEKLDAELAAAEKEAASLGHRRRPGEGRGVADGAATSTRSPPPPTLTGEPARAEPPATSTGSRRRTGGVRGARRDERRRQ